MSYSPVGELNLYTMHRLHAVKCVKRDSVTELERGSHVEPDAFVNERHSTESMGGAICCAALLARASVDSDVIGHDRSLSVLTCFSHFDGPHRE
jgi:hypothetical protein